MLVAWKPSTSTLTLTVTSILRTWIFFAIFNLGPRSAWRAALKRAELQIRFHDLRHTCITKLAESQASEHTLMAIAGHVSRKMIGWPATHQTVCAGLPKDPVSQVSLTH
jgi:integrase